MTPDPSTNPLDSAPAASGPTPPEKFEPTPPPGPTSSSPSGPASPGAAAPSGPTPTVPPAPTATPQQAAAADTVEHTGVSAPAPEPPKELPTPAPTPAAAAPGTPAPEGVAPAPGQLEAAAEAVTHTGEQESEGLSTTAKVGIAAAATAATAAAGAAVAAVANALSGDDTDKATKEGGDEEKATAEDAEPPKVEEETPAPATASTAPLAARMKGTADSGETKPAAPEPNVPHVPKEGELGGEDLVKAETPAEPAAKAAPAPPARSQGIAIPKSAELDKSFEEELAAGMSDDALSLQMNTGAKKSGAGGPDVSGTDPATGKGPGQPIGGDEAATPAPQIGDEENIEPGTKLMGKVDSKTDSDIFVNLETSRLQGIIPRTDYPDGNGPPEGFSGAFFVDRVDTENGLIHLSSPRGRRKVTGDWDSVNVGQTVECSVTGTNKGGLQVQVGQLRGFMPASQIDIGFVSDMGQFVGQRLQARVIEVKPEKKNLVLSRAAVLKEERKGLEKELWDTLKVGDVRDGIVRAMKPYGAFVDIGGVDGFLHIGEISHNRIGHPSDVLNDGQKIQVKVLKVDPESRKVGLGMKQLEKDPWQQLEESYPVGSTLKGKVTRCTEFGAFVEIEEGVEGLIHISELDHKRVSRVSDVVRVNEEVEVKVLTVEPNRKRVSLSLKALKDKPASAAPRGGRKKKEDEEPELPAYERQRKGPLKGGTGGKNAGGLFGDPSQFGG
ncbi:30S ribosomal protein S1 [Alienimonas sp. DA493]|uniref:30S ribosomal protein S1 n=1 Tax=Alienimonas sp. DA493 TaxID=3373605 RepID=UPI0037550799